MKETFWPIFVTFATAAWFLYCFIRDRMLKSIEQDNRVIQQLIESDNYIIMNPDVQLYLANNFFQDVDYFRLPDRLKESIFFKAKAHIYKKLNQFDDVLTICEFSKKWYQFHNPKLFETEAWEAYIMRILRHPLCISILENEVEIFGKKLQEFWEDNNREIKSHDYDPFSW